jgi:hypothetical protein
MFATFVPSSVAQVRRYRDPLDDKKYYFRYGTPAEFTHETCSGILKFDPILLLCVQEPLSDPPPLKGKDTAPCGDNYDFYCNGNTFTYCTRDRLIIAENLPCTGDGMCYPDNDFPCE